VGSSIIYQDTTIACESFNTMSELSIAELDDIYAFAVELGKEAGKMLMEAARVRMGDAGSHEQREHVQKENAVDLVTETDESKVAILCG
jgi:myo-inositol-1(or 4)-monophosphatase